ncbi:molybdopterin-dependent oxidoreductase [Hyphomicrobium sp. CS1GBMeth3]|uniref:molybdopterin-dependent oxidoreductase n=1 Tax=Hyphomicrobium sp. CS1GBMeth3 TaxID=1892845 RepID=UPI00093019FF|nr:molybdopterin-dependent oxidoreductase [Hyphomicrobium sp. CS1GBMeth3]
MSELLMSRRKLLRLGTVGASSLVVAGCDQFDFLGRNDSTVRSVLAKANDLTYHAQRLLIRDGALAPEYEESDIRQGQRPNGSRDPQSKEYAALRANDFAEYRLRVTGLVERQREYRLGELHNMPSRTQITRHDCVEGWSCIAKWTGAPLSHLLDEAGMKPAARFVVFHCYDRYGSPDGDLYYESCDLIDARHPQTILAYGLNDGPLPVANGAPIRVRIERALGYKQPKYVHTIELVESFSHFGRGKGGFWEDRGYDWFAGI